ncbi:MAG TPA: AAA family ATPase [Dictyobacter sp.]|jgi:protein phosphatase|nr:AAA family ATPase [Dictyobacter sp.]
MEYVPERSAQIVLSPQRSLIVLCGPAGSGKSTFAQHFIERHQHEGYQPTTIVSSDHCRAMICDDENSQQVTRDAFDLFYYIIHKRFLQGHLTIADSTALKTEARQHLLQLAQRYQYQTCLIVFNRSLQICLQHDRQLTRGRSVGERVIRYHFDLLRQALQKIPQEGWQQVYVLDEEHQDFDIILG